MKHWSASEANINILCEEVCSECSDIIEQCRQTNWKGLPSAFTGRNKPSRLPGDRCAERGLMSPVTQLRGSDDGFRCSFSHFQNFLQLPYIGFIKNIPSHRPRASHTEDFVDAGTRVDRDAFEIDLPLRPWLLLMIKQIRFEQCLP